MDSKKVRTRFAPSPTGFMHVGNLRTALFSYLLAKKMGGVFILRIEDTDQTRYVEGAVEMIYHILRETGLHYDEGPDVGGDYGPYVQSQRKAIYWKYAHKLIDTNHAYYCFCDKERLDTIREEFRLAKMDPKYDGHCRDLSAEEIQKNLEAKMPFIIRQKMPTTGTSTFDDMVFGTIEVDFSQLDDQVLIKADGLPTYNFANVIDDHLMEISHIIRGSEFLISTPKYNELYKAFGWEMPTLVHVPPVMKAAGQKMSKRFGDASYDDFIKKGYLKDAIINYIALLGWSPGDNREMFTLPELVNAFDINNINKAPAIFDEVKLSWLSGEYIRKLSLEEFHQMAVSYITQAISRPPLNVRKISQMLQPRVEKLIDIPAQIDFIDSVPDYSVDLYNHQKMKSNPESSLTFLKSALPVLNTIDTWTEEHIHTAVFAFIEQSKIKTGQLLWPLRIALSGKQSTPGGFIEIAYVLGKEETIKRVEEGIKRLETEKISGSHQ
jgi:glutamyl-tRNA synthetase